MPNVIVGPWLGEVGHELLYWIPYLRKQVERGRFVPADATIVSRGGVKDWYRDIGEKYVETFNHISPAVFRAQNVVRERMTGKMKQLGVEDFDVILIEAVHGGKSLVVHPSEMFRLFEPCWSEARSIQHILEHTVHRKMEIESSFPCSLRYAAIKFYWSKCFPQTDENCKFVDSLVKSIRQEYGEVVSLSGARGVDGHSDYVPNDVGKTPCTMPESNLLVQSKCLAGAAAFYGTYGGFSYLATTLGVPSYLFYSERNFISTHLSVAQEVSRALGVEFEVTRVS